jgi:hypothetical protein
LADSIWFEEIAYKFPWGTFIEGLDKSNSFKELKYYFQSMHA